MATEIRYWLPGGVWITYSGDEKPYYVWLKETFIAYIAAWKLWFRFFLEIARLHGIFPALVNPKIVSMCIPKMLEHMIQKARKDTADD